MTLMKCQNLLRPLLFLIFLSCPLFAGDKPLCQIYERNLFTIEVDDVFADIRIGIVKDYFREIPTFPRIEVGISPMSTIDAQVIVDLFYEHALKAKAFADKLEGRERQNQMELHDFIIRRLQMFASQYSSFDPTSVVLDHLKYISNHVKGKSFEALIEAIIDRAGFKIEATNIRFDKTKFHVDDNVIKNSTNELDIVATRNNQNYIFEIKNIKPKDELDPYDLKVREKILQQVRSVTGALAKSVEHQAQYVIIFHFDLGGAFKQQLLEHGADRVIYLRKEYLDDIEKY